MQIFYIYIFFNPTDNNKLTGVFFFFFFCVCVFFVFVLFVFYPRGGGIRKWGRQKD